MDERKNIPEYIQTIKSIQLGPWPHIGRQLHRQYASGYVYAIEELGSNMVFIGWCGTTPLKETLRMLQKGNPRQLRVLKIMRRSNVYDAHEIYKFIHNGIFLENVRGNWFEIEHYKIHILFKSIDSLNDRHPKNEYQKII